MTSTRPKKPSSVRPRLLPEAMSLMLFGPASGPRRQPRDDARQEEEGELGDEGDGGGHSDVSLGRQHLRLLDGHFVTPRDDERLGRRQVERAASSAIRGERRSEQKGEHGCVRAQRRR